jgi:hypothetical protein
MQISSLAVETDVKAQFWLSQVTVMAMLLLSGICKPERAGWPAHKMVESQVALTLLCESCTSVPPQPASSKVLAKTAPSKPNLN